MDVRKQLEVDDSKYHYFSLRALEKILQKDLSNFPFSLKVLLENLIRHHKERASSDDEIEAIVSWSKNNVPEQEISFYPARVVMQDFTGVPAVVDLAAMRDALSRAGGDPGKINPQIPVDLVIDHSVMVDHFGSEDSFQINVRKEFERNAERYRFLKWGQEAFEKFRVVPPGTGIVHQVNLEYLAKVVWTEASNKKTMVYPDTMVGTDSHTTMINGLAVLGWGVGGIEAEAALLGQAITMLIPHVVGFELTGQLKEGITATDLVLTITQILRKKGVVGKFVEFFGSGLDDLTIEDRATISNMSPEFGSTCAIFPIDEKLLDYLRLTGRDEKTVKLTEKYAKEQGLWRDESWQPEYNDTLKLDLSDVEPCMAGPRRSHDRVLLREASAAFEKTLSDYYQVKNRDEEAQVEGKDYKLKHGDVVIAAITSCTNTSNPSTMLAAGLLAKKATELGLKAKPWVKTSLAPGSKVVTEYYKKSGLDKDLNALGFNLVGYGCTTCIGNSGPLPESIRKAIKSADLVTCNVLSGNRNFEGRISPDSKASYLASPPLVVAYAIAGSIRTNIHTDPIGRDKNGKAVYLKDIWPSNAEIKEAVEKSVDASMFKTRYADVFSGTREWQEFETSKSKTYDWEKSSTYIKSPPFFKDFSPSIPGLEEIRGARCLAILPDSTTTDHISPAGVIPTDGPAGKYLISNGIEPALFNSFGSRRGNHEVMMRGTFANIRILNKMAEGTEGGFTRMPDGKIIPIYDAAVIYSNANIPLLVFAGKEYGTGSSRDWAAKGTLLLGVRAVVAESYERIHRSNLIGMGVLPLEFMKDHTVKGINITGGETFDILGISDLKPKGTVRLNINRENGQSESVTLRVRIDTAGEYEYYRHKGILNYVLHRLSA
ncbi:MAG: aconitate hydratase AcnA [Spirochaetota bacterium]|nr:MAG: aconitate hydratase AcnA [Spirochaetota bacterium]